MSEERQQSTLNERFTDFADKVSEMMGRWWVTATSFLALLAWLALGPFMHFSDSWQLIANTPTTWIELFIGFLLAAATNRVERRHDALLEQIKAHAGADLHTTEHDAETNRQAEKKIDQLSRDMQTIKRMLAKVVTEV